MTRWPERRWGQGEREVVFLHGFTGSRCSFDHLEPLVGDALTARCLELPGHGEAPLPDGDFDGVVDALATQLERPAVVFGYSQGARLALALAVKHPHLVTRLILESGSPGLHRRHDRAQRRRADDALAGLIEHDGVEPFIARWEQLPLFAGLRALPDDVKAKLHARRTNHRAKALAAALRVMGQGAQPDLWPALPLVRAPTLLITGSADGKYTRLAKRMAAELPLAWRVSLPRVGHAPHLEAADVWAAEVRSFLQAGWTHEPRAEVAT